MKNPLAQELEILQELFRSANRPFPKVTGAADSDFKRVFEVTGIRLEGSMEDLYSMMNGSDQEEILAVFSDEPTSCQFNSIDFALYTWGAAEPSVDVYYRELQKAWDGCRQEPPRDSRIKEDLWVNKLWFPFAEFNGGSTVIYWDADPVETGNLGQIIVYQHDPEGIYYVAPDFLSFLKRSNNLFVEYRQVLLERIWKR